MGKGEGGRVGGGGRGEGGRIGGGGRERGEGWRRRKWEHTIINMLAKKCSHIPMLRV